MKGVKMEDFIDSLSKGKQGEALIYKAFTDMGYKVIDASMDKEY